MRELLKSMSSFSWAMSLFGVEQAGNVLSPGKSASALNAVAGAAEKQLGSLTGEAFRSGDALQRGMIDMMFGQSPSKPDTPTSGPSYLRAIEYPNLADGPSEEVLLVTVSGGMAKLHLKEAMDPFYPEKLGGMFRFPHSCPPYDGPPMVDEEARAEIEGSLSYSKHFLRFPDGSSFATTGPTVAKLVPMQGGVAQFWAPSVQTIADGTGRYEGARGMAVFHVSSHLKLVPDSTKPGGLQHLEDGFGLQLSMCSRIVMKDDRVSLG